MDPHTVLVVEDNPAVRRALVDLLEIAGLAVVEAGNGIQALRRLEAGLVPAVILLDLELPFMSGWHLQRQLRRHPILSRVPVVILTAHEIGSSGVPGARAVLHKPVGPEALLETLNRCIDSGRGTRSRNPALDFWVSRG